MPGSSNYGTKICDTCGCEFYKKINNQRFCSDKCRYSDPSNTEKRKADNLKRRARQLLFIRRVKVFYGCSMCGYKDHPAALQFDHISPENKSFELSKGHMRSMRQIKEEMKKCRILCANCHSIHTFNQKQGG